MSLSRYFLPYPTWSARDFKEGEQSYPFEVSSIFVALMPTARVAPYRASAAPLSNCVTVATFSIQQDTIHGWRSSLKLDIEVLKSASMIPIRHQDRVFGLVVIGRMRSVYG